MWAYLTGGAQIAAGVAMLSGVQARLAAILLTVMYASFSALVHIPMLLADPKSPDNWTENGINLVLTRAAWALVDTLGWSGEGQSVEEPEPEPSCACSRQTSEQAVLKFLVASLLCPLAGSRTAPAGPPLRGDAKRRP